jgi:hypothetical protein
MAVGFLSLHFGFSPLSVAQKPIAFIWLTAPFGDLLSIWGEI